MTKYQPTINNIKCTVCGKDMVITGMLHPGYNDICGVCKIRSGWYKRDHLTKETLGRSDTKWAIEASLKSPGEVFMVNGETSTAAYRDGKLIIESIEGLCTVCKRVRGCDYYDGSCGVLS